MHPIMSRLPQLSGGMFPHIRPKITTRKFTLEALGVTAAVGVFGIGFFASRYRVAGPSQYIVSTGLGIDDIKVSKKWLQWPFQRARVMDISPVTFPINVDAMSAQRIPFRMPSVWTIGPKNDPDSLQNYARLLMDKGQEGVQETVSGVIQGETRVLTANLDLSNLFSDRDAFKSEVVQKINEVILPFGLTVYNANIAELADLDDQNRYFSEQKKRALQKVNEEARVAVAEAIKEGETGEKTHVGETRQVVAKVERDAVLVENERQKEIQESSKDLEVAKASYQREVDIAQSEARAAAQKRDLELQQDVERTRKEQEIERQRAKEWSAANVEAEVAIKRAEGKAEALRIEADGKLFAELKIAEGIIARRKAEAEGLRSLVEAAGDIDGVNRYLLIEKDVLQELAKKQAEALQGLNPKVTVWNTGSAQSSLSHTLTDLFRTGMPLFDGIKQQTGYDFVKSFGIKKIKSEEES